MTISADELVRVIKACHKARVTELKIGEIEVKFGNGETPEPKTTAVASPVVTEAELKEAQHEVLVKENLDHAEARLDLMQLEDPAQYERLILERELEDSGKSAEISEH